MEDGMMSVAKNVFGLVEMVERGEFLEAFSRFYAHDAVVQENDNPPRVGLEALLANERRILSAFKSVVGRARRTFIDDDLSVIHWFFEFTTPRDVVISLDELALQTWREGRIVHEKFYYDPIQMRAPAQVED
jgi:hypothetical protein